MAFAFTPLSTILSASSAINELTPYVGLNLDQTADYFVVDVVDNIGFYKSKKMSYGSLRDISFYDNLTQTPYTYYNDILSAYNTALAPKTNSVVGAISSLIERISYTERRTNGLSFGTLELSSNAYLALSGANQKVGIGTTNPNAKLTVVGDISSNLCMYASAGTFNGNINSGTNGFIDIQGPNGVVKGNLRLTHNTGGLDIYTNNENTTPKISINYRGNLGIGTATDNIYQNVPELDKLTIAGNTRFQYDTGNFTKIVPQESGGINIETYKSNLYTRDGYVGISKEGNITTPANVTAQTINSNSTIHATGNISTSGQFVGYGTIPIGGIIMWSGSHNSIPTGWHLCDGSTVSGHLTPDLRERFVKCSSSPGGGTAINTKGGNASETITLTQNHLPKHRHDFIAPTGEQFFVINDSNDVRPTDSTYSIYRDQGPDKLKDARWYPFTGYTGSDNPSPINIAPPYYVLAFIMRVA